MKVRSRNVCASIAVAAVGALGLLGLLSATASTARASVKPPPDYVVASISFEANFGVPVVFTSVDGALCLPPALESCFVGVPLLVFSSLTTSGTTIWTDPSRPNFDAIVGELTDGDSGLMSWALIAPMGVAGASIVAQSERDLFDDQVGPSGVDLAGYRIDRIGLRVDSISFDSPGTNPNGDGIWTSFAFEGAFLFEGRIASKEACKGGGWQSLHGPGGRRFENQGQCIQLVNTGK
jgi:hypothetical protein